MKQVAWKRHREKRMRWLGTQKELISFFYGLIEERKIGKEAKSVYAAVIAHCFVNRSGKTITPAQLRVVKSDVLQWNKRKLARKKCNIERVTINALKGV